MTRPAPAPRAGGSLAPRLWRVLGVALAMALAAAPRAVAGERQEVSVARVDGVYSIDAQFQVPQAPAEVLAVLTDYDSIPDFLPDIRRSTVRSRDGARTVVEQEAASGLMLFSKTVHLLLEIDESDDALCFRDTAGRSFEVYQGAWRLTRAGDATLVRYELRAKPAFAVPDFMLVRIFKRDSRKTIERIVGEIARRTALASHATR